MTPEERYDEERQLSKAEEIGIIVFGTLMLAFFGTVFYIFTTILVPPPATDSELFNYEKSANFDDIDLY